MQLRKHRIMATCAAAAVLAGYPFFATAETTPQDAADYRVAVMTSLKGHIGAVSMHVRGLVDGQEFLLKHAQGIANGASELDRLFPAGSNVEGSDSLPLIWEEPDEFATAIEHLVSATDKLVQAAGGGNPEEIGAAFLDVGGSCKGCHDTFRKPHD